MEEPGIFFLVMFVKLAFMMLLIGWIPAVIASRKGRNFFLWWLYGGGLFIIALVHALLLTSNKCKICGNRIALSELSTHMRAHRVSTSSSAARVVKDKSSTTPPQEYIGVVTKGSSPIDEIERCEICGNDVRKAWFDRHMREHERAVR